jgi:hypothetical protein
MFTSYCQYSCLRNHVFGSRSTQQANIALQSLKRGPCLEPAHTPHDKHHRSHPTDTAHPYAASDMTRSHPKHLAVCNWRPQPCSGPLPRYRASERLRHNLFFSGQRSIDLRTASRACATNLDDIAYLDSNVEPSYLVWMSVSV